MNVVNDAERYLYAHGYHDQGDFRVQFGHGRTVDLREIVADFAELYHTALIARVHAWQKLAEDAVNSRPTPPIILPAEGEHDGH